RDVLDELQAALAGVPAGALRRLDRLIGIRVRYPDSVRFDPDRVIELPLVFGAAAPPGPVVAPSAVATAGAFGTVPIAAAARPERDVASAVLVREGLQPAVIVTADFEGGDLGAVMRDVQRQLTGMAIPSGYRMEVGGQFASQQETFANLAMVAAF